MFQIVYEISRWLLRGSGGREAGLVRRLKDRK